MATSVVDPSQIYTAAELRRLPPEQRDAILASAAAAEQEYRNDRALNVFDAFGEEDLHGDSADSRPG